MLRISLLFITLILLCIACYAIYSNIMKRRLADEILHDSYVDLNRYMGKWYEIASYPNYFQTNCTCSTATYSLQEDFSKVNVLNQCLPNNEINGIAYSTNENNTWLKVNFVNWIPFNLASGDYWILYINNTYTKAIVGSGKSYLWILSKTPQISRKEFTQLTKIAQNKGYDIHKLQITCPNAVKLVK